MTSIAESFVDDGFHFKPTEAEKIEAWRLKCALDFGYAIPNAEIIAASKIDLHTLKQLLERGASLDQALRILL